MSLYKTLVPPLLTESLIQAQLVRLSLLIDEHYRSCSLGVSLENPLLLLVILKGSAVFYVNLMQKLAERGLPVTCEFISISSYGQSTESSGEVRFELDTRNSITERHVLVLEDIIDTGRTLSAVIKQLECRKPASLEIATLLSKPSRREMDVDVKFTGFVIQDHFVVGYGLDYAERLRELPYIGILTDEYREKIDQANLAETKLNMRKNR